MNIARSRKGKKPVGERIVQEALPAYEPKIKEMSKVSRYGEKRNEWQDGYSGIGWRVAVLDCADVCIEEVKDMPQRERRGAPKFTKKILKAQSTRFSNMLETTERLRGVHGIDEYSVDGDFLTGATKNIQRINPMLWNGLTIIDDYVLLSGFMRRMSDDGLGDFDMKIDPNHELEEGKLSLVCVGEGTSYDNSKADPWLPFKESAGPLLAVHGLSRGAYAGSFFSSMHTAIDHSINIAAKLANDPLAEFSIEEKFFST